MAAEIERLHARIRRLKDRNAQLEAMLVALAEARPEEPAIELHNSTITINSTFTDADLTKLSKAFREDLIKAAQRRYTASTDSTFGT